MSKLLNQSVICTDRPNETGTITYYDSDSGEMNLQYGNEVGITHISKCKVVK